MSRLPVLAGVAAIVCLVGASLAADEPKTVPLKLVTYKVQRDKLQPEIVERGTLDATNSVNPTPFVACANRSMATGMRSASRSMRAFWADQWDPPSSDDQ